MTRGPLRRIIARDLRILAILDANELAPKQIAVIFNVTPSVVYDAARRRRLFPARYLVFHEEQLSKTIQRREQPKNR